MYEATYHRRHTDGTSTTVHCSSFWHALDLAADDADAPSPVALPAAITVDTTVFTVAHVAALLDVTGFLEIVYNTGIAADDPQPLQCYAF